MTEQEAIDIFNKTHGQYIGECCYNCDFWETGPCMGKCRFDKTRVQRSLGRDSGKCDLFRAVTMKRWKVTQNKELPNAR